MKYIILSITLVLMSVTAQSQTLDFFDIDASKFPIIKAKFFAFDANGDQVINILPTDFNVREEGQNRRVLSVSCKTFVEVEPVSTVLVMDASGSMRRRNIELAKSAARAWINAMPDGESECAITAFDNVNYLIQDFTSIKSLLLEKVDDLFAFGGTNYNAAFIEELYGGLVMTRNARHKKVIVLMTDGMPTNTTLKDAIIEEAKIQGALVYAVTLGMPCPDVLKEITEFTGGAWFENVSSPQHAAEIYNQILKKVSGAEACEITWESDVSCSPGERIADIDFYPIVLNRLVSYPLPSEAIIGIGISHESVFFKNVLPGNSKDTVITITATTGDLSVSDIKIDNSAFSILPRAFSIKRGESQQLRLTYDAPQGGDYIWTKLTFYNNLCPLQMFASGGFAGKRPEKNTLLLIHPNGGELFIAGNDTLVTWEGIPESDSVRLEYSYDNGNNWVAVANKTTSGKHNWMRIPRTPSTECLMRVTQLQLPPDQNPEWARGLGADYYFDLEDKHTGAASDIYGNLYVATIFKERIRIEGDFYESVGEEDILVIKFNPQGLIEWITQIGGADKDIVSGITVDIFGNSYITGRFNQSINIDGKLIYSKGGSDAFISKILPDGTIEWFKNFGSIGDDYSNDICLDNQNNLIITGAFSQTATFDKIILNSNGGLDIFTAKLTPEGSCLWAKGNGGLYHDEGTAVAADKLNKIWSAGKFSKNATIEGNNLISGGTDSEFADFEIFVSKYFANGTNEWVINAGGAGDDEPFAIICSPENDAYLTGTYTDTARFGTHIAEPISSSTNSTSDAFLTKILSDGSFYWLRTAGSGASEQIWDIAIDQNGYPIITGAFINDAMFEQTKLSSKGFYDVFVAKYSNNGELQFAKRGGGSFADIGRALTVDGLGNAFVVGNFIKAGDFGSKILSTSFGLMDLFVWGVGGGDDALQQDVSNLNWTIVAPKSNALDVDMGITFVGSIRDSLVEYFIQNIGSYDFKVDSILIVGTDKDAFTVVSKSSDFIVETGTGSDIEFRFKPTKAGIHKADLIVYTQSDTLRKSIRGEGVLPKLQIVNQVIDFGRVLVGEYKDTIGVVTLKNNGSEPIEIFKTLHNKPNDKDFTTLKGSGSFIINPEQTVTMDLRFSPLEKGRTSGTLEFHYEGTGSPAVVLLAGEGINPNPSIVIANNYFDELFCESSAKANVQISNRGGATLIIDNIYLSGNNADNFSIKLEFPIILEPERTQIIEVNYYSNVPGIKSADLVLVSNAKPDSLFYAPITLISNGAKAEVSDKVIDFGILDIDESAEKTIQISNPGNYATLVNIDKGLGIETDKESFVLLPKQVQDLTVSFNGQTLEGDFSTTIKVVDTLCKIESIIEVSALISKRESALITANYDMMPKLNCIDRAKSQITLTNKGKEILYLISIEIVGDDKVDFTFEMPDKMLINPDELLVFDYYFEPKSVGLKSAELIIQNNSANSPNLAIPLSARYEPVNSSFPENQVDIGKIAIGQSKEFLFYFSNTGAVKNTFTLKSTSNLSLNLMRYELNPGQKVSVSGFVNPFAIAGQISESVTVIDSICQVAKVVSIEGIVGAGAGFTIVSGSKQAFIGDKVEIPITVSDIINPDNIDITNIDFKLKFNSTILAPESRVNYSDVDGIGTLEFNNIQVNLRDDNTIINIPFDIGLGNSEETELQIFDLFVNGENISAQSQNGKFTSLGICYEGGTRLFNPNGKKGGIKSITPNPSNSENIIIEVELIENGLTKIGVFNSTGYLKQEFELYDRGTNLIILDPNSYESGVYYIHFTSPTISDIKKLIIVK